MGEERPLVSCWLEFRLVLYLPSATALMTDAFYAKRAETEMYDTIGAAKDILKSVYSVYGGETSPLSELPQTQPNDSGHDFGKTLEDLCRNGLASGSPVESCCISEDFEFSLPGLCLRCSCEAA